MVSAFGRTGIVTVGRVSIFIRGGPNELTSVANFLTSNKVDVHTFSVTSAASFNVLELVISSASGTTGMLGRRNITISVARIIKVSVPSIANTFTGIIGLLSSTKRGIRCTCTFLAPRRKRTCIVFEISGGRGTYRRLGRGNISIVRRGSLLWFGRFGTQYYYVKLFLQVYKHFWFAFFVHYSGVFGGGVMNE